MSAEWKGPWKCEKCGYRYVAGVPGGRCRCGEDEETRCTGTLVPYDRRAPAPSCSCGYTGADQHAQTTRCGPVAPAPSADGLREAQRAIHRIVIERDRIGNVTLPSPFNNAIEMAARLMGDTISALPAPQEAPYQPSAVTLGEFTRGDDHPVTVTDPAPQEAKGERDVAGEVWDIVKYFIQRGHNDEAYLAVRRAFPANPLTTTQPSAHPTPSLRAALEEARNFLYWLGSAEDISSAWDARIKDIKAIVDRALLRASPASDEAVVVERVARIVEECRGAGTHETARRILAIVRGDG